MFNSVEIEINHSCDRSCSYCPNSVDERIEKGSMTQELYTEIMSQLKSLNYNGKIAYHFYNEPLLSKDLELFVKLTKEFLPDTTLEIYSNGTRLSIVKLRQLKTLGVDFFIVTKHEGIEHYLFDETWESLTNDEKQFVKYKKYNEINLTNRGGILNIGSEAARLLPCQIPSFMLTISVKGNIIPCFEDFYQYNSMGNVLEKNLIDIWNSEKYLNFREKLKLGLRHQFLACNNCNRREVRQPSFGSF